VAQGYSFSRGFVVATTVVDPRGNPTTSRFTPDGFPRESTDPLGQTTRQERDAGGRLVRTTDPLGRVTQFAYDASGNVTTITDPLGNTRTFTYDPAWGTAWGTLHPDDLCGSLPIAMPRQPRLDAPETLHHVMVRGLERRVIFRDDQDQADFVARLAALAEQGALTVYAWALLPNHAHLLVRTGTRPLPRSMRRLLTGYAGAFNRRHKRVGHLFQNRYKSIVVEEERYLLELVRYLHLNPLRAGVVKSLAALERYPWTGHSALLGTVPRAWQDTRTVLAQFGPTTARARKAYRALVAAGLPQGRRPDLQGGGLVRSLGGWQAVAALRRGREAYRGDERVLGSSAFVEALQHAAEAAEAPRGPRLALETLLAGVCRHVGLPREALGGGGRRTAVQQARAGLAYLWVAVLGHPGRPLAPLLGVQPAGVLKAAQRGAREAVRWHRLLAKCR
jgi:YD repeat-containing protein